MQEKFQMMSSNIDNDSDDMSLIHCNYYGTDEFQKAKFDSSKSF